MFAFGKEKRTGKKGQGAAIAQTARWRTFFEP
jgi:hypothetical protein